MHTEDQKAILAIALHAAFADGSKDERERDEVRRIAETLATESARVDLRAVVQDVLLKRLSLDDAVAMIQDQNLRLYAYETALCVCEADGRTSDAERAFLNRLKSRLGTGDELARTIEREVEPFVPDAAPIAASGPVTAAGPVANPLGATVAMPVAVAPGVPAPVSVAVPAVVAAATAPPVASAELDRSILNYALLTGALELLPQSWASMAIIPLQIKMVYGIGQAHGVSLDQGHIKEFIAAAGVGMTSQYLEQFSRKLLGGLLGKAAGKAVGRIGSAATGMAFSFATTYALGQLARRYYAGGRTMNTVMLRDTFQSLLGPAKQLQTQYLPQIQQKAATLDAGQVMAMIRNP